MATEWNQIQRRMNSCEQIITGLLSLDVVTNDLEKKLCQLEEWIVYIPDSRQDLIDEWNRKLVNWWKEYVTAKSLQQGKQQKSKQCSCILSDQLSSDMSFDSKPTSEPIHNLPSKSSESNRHSVNSQNLVDVQLSKQTLLDQMEHAFSQLDPVPECENAPEYWDRMSQLATLITKARSLAIGMPGDTSSLQGEIFMFAYAKLSSKLQQSYRQFDHFFRFKSLIALRKLLSKQITDHIQQEDENRKLINIDGIFCLYCKKSGHLKDNCPAKRAKVCFKCFKMGHMKKDCTD